MLLIQGKVTINAKSGEKLEIPDGAVLENKVIDRLLFIYFAYYSTGYMTCLYTCWCPGYQWPWRSLRKLHHV